MFLCRVEVLEAAAITGTLLECVVGTLLSGGDCGGVVMPGTSSHVCKKKCFLQMNGSSKVNAGFVGSLQHATLIFVFD